MERDDDLNDIIDSINDCEIDSYKEENYRFSREIHQGPDIYSKHFSEPNIYKHKELGRSNSTSIGSLSKKSHTSERDMIIGRMSQEFDEYSEIFAAIHAWIVPKEIIKNTDRFHLMKPWKWQRHNQGIKHKNFSDNNDFVEAFQKMPIVLENYLAYSKTYLESGWQITTEVLHQFNWFEGNFAILDQIIEAMDKNLSRKMTKDHRKSVQEKIKKCKYTIREIQVFSSASKRGILRN